MNGPGLDEQLMRRAIELARNNPSFPFGAVIAETGTGEVLGEGWNQGADNPTWHGEIVAINNLFESIDQPATHRLTLYTTAEPCSMCQSAIHWAGLARVVYGSSIPTLISFGFHQISLRAADVQCRAPFHDCEITGGVLEAECDELFKQSRKSVG